MKEKRQLGYQIRRARILYILAEEKVVSGYIWRPHSSWTQYSVEVGNTLGDNTRTILLHATGTGWISFNFSLPYD